MEELWVDISAVRVMASEVAAASCFWRSAMRSFTASSFVLFCSNLFCHVNEPMVFEKKVILTKEEENKHKIKYQQEKE